MEFEDVNRQIEWQAQRIVTAFGMAQWDIHAESDSVRVFGAYTENRVLEECLDDLVICELAFGDSHNLTSISIPPLPNLPRFDSSCYDDIMDRGLYRLGFEDEDVLTELNHPLSHHEKLELRLSMPREFWPQKWLDEQAKSGTVML